MAQRKRLASSAKAIENIRVQDAAGESLRLGTLWEDGPAVLVWLRHYG